MDAEQSAVSIEMNNEDEVLHQAEALANAGHWKEAASILRRHSPLCSSRDRFGPVSNYNSERGFGFIKDEADGASVFLHITRVQNRVTPRIGTRTKYLREVGEKGFQAAKVWLLNN